jgi:hypothetical protein
MPVSLVENRFFNLCQKLSARHTAVILSVMCIARLFIAVISPAAWLSPCFPAANVGCDNCHLNVAEQKRSLAKVLRGLPSDFKDPCQHRFAVNILLTRTGLHSRMFLLNAPHPEHLCFIPVTTRPSLGCILCMPTIPKNNFLPFILWLVLLKSVRLSAYTVRVNTSQPCAPINFISVVSCATG